MPGVLATDDRVMRSRRPSVTSILRQIGLVATREELRAAGVRGSELTTAVRAGEILRLRRAHYSLPTIPEECALAVRLGGRLGGNSAARSYGWWDGADDRVHVSWPPHGNVAVPGRARFASQENAPKLVHHWRILREQLRGEPSTWRESPEQTLAQVLLTSDRVHGVATADSALHRGSLSTLQVAAVFAAMPARIQAWESLVDGVPDSGIESIVRIWLVDRSIRFAIHANIDGVGEVDFIVGSSLIIEVDGKLGHDDEVGRLRDYRRDTASGSSGYITIRWNYPQVMFDWASCVAQISEHLRRGDHRRPVRQ